MYAKATGGKAREMISEAEEVTTMRFRSARLAVLVILAAITAMTGATCGGLLGTSDEVAAVRSSCPGMTVAEIQSLIDMTKGLELAGTSKAIATEQISKECQGDAPSNAICNTCAGAIADLVYGIQIQPGP